MVAMGLGVRTGALSIASPAFYHNTSASLLSCEYVSNHTGFVPPMQYAIYFLVQCCQIIRLFANDVIMIGSVRADWPAPFSVTIGNPRADKLGRNGFECIGRRCLVDRERCVRATFMHGAIENYSMLHLQRWLECRGIKRFGTKSLFMIISHNCQSCMCRQ